MQQTILNNISQKTAEAIESVLNIDVTIMNEDNIRIAGTGKYKDCLFEAIEKTTVFDFCFKTGKHYVIEEAGKNDICKLCYKRNRCKELSEICVPIKNQNKIIGVIGVIAFKEEQRVKIVKNKEKYVNFIFKMASLLEAKYSEIIISRENIVLSNRLHNILDTMHDAIIMYCNEGNPIYKNTAFIRLLESQAITDDNKFSRKLWQYIKNNTLYTEDSEHNEIIIKYDGESHSFLADIYILKKNDYSDELFVSLKDYKVFHTKFIQHSENNNLTFAFDKILSISPNFIEVKEFAKQAALSDSNILITGESGTGKELFARSIHNYSLRNKNTFVPINCGAIPETLLESELFGHEKGAFTGAVNTKIGKFEVANDGTIFLDEICEMPYVLQVKLLRVLQEHEICRIGSNKLKKINVRFISATNADIKNKINEKLFREDLYYRLNIIPIKIPPLRERKDDIMYTANYYIDYYNKIFNKKIVGLSEEASNIFNNYSWPGNVRELKNVIEFAAHFTTSNFINADLIKRRIMSSYGSPQIDNSQNPITAEHSLNKGIDFLEKEVLVKKIIEYENLKKGKAAEAVCRDLEISRATFYRKINKYNIVF